MRGIKWRFLNGMRSALCGAIVWFLTTGCWQSRAAPPQTRAQQTSSPNVTSRPSSPLFLSRAPEQLTICSQNLANYGLPEEVARRVTSKKGVSLELREKLLVERFRRAGCQIIAVQEVVGQTAKAARAGLERLATQLSLATTRRFVPFLGEANSGDVRVGFLVSTEQLIVERAVSYAGALLPQLERGERFQRLSRGPLVVQVRWGKRRITLVAIHLKSKYGGGRDPSRLQFELLRMQMAEHIRLLAEAHFASELIGDHEWFIVLGDRNSRPESASNRILRGDASLSDFRSTGGCIVSKGGESICAGEPHPREPRFDSVLVRRFIEGEAKGTYQFRERFEWIDDILINRWALRPAIQQGETPRTQVVWEPKGASDHALVAVTLFQPNDGDKDRNLQ